VDVNTHMATLSNQLMLGTVLLYVVAMVGYAADLAFGERERRRAPVAQAVGVLVGAGGPEAPGDSEAAAGVVETPGDSEEPARRQVSWGRFAVLMNVLGWGVHLGELVTRGLAAHRVPWGNMYEFMSAITFAAVTVFLVMLWRQKIRFLGVFVMVAAVVALGIATILLYDDPAPLRPALHSYWIAIHVTAAIIATGVFMVAGVTSVLFVLKSRSKPVAEGGILDRLPSAESLDRISHRTIMFAFPIWTFAIIAGAIWADSAWGRYWGWDPKETWSFITWVGYACYLHARATAGWRGKKATYIALIAFGCLLFNFFGINYLVSGLHSYAPGG
jgi:cytochrome c-type biogenesis protein CcsB